MNYKSFFQNQTTKKIATDDMVDLNYKDLIEKMPNGFAYHQLITDAEGKGIDYVFLEVNQAFENITGLKREEILGKKVTEVLKGILNEEEHWIERYSKVALTGTEDTFEAYSKEIDTWFRVFAFSPKERFFAVIIENITQKKKEYLETALYKLLLDKTSDMITILDVSMNPKYIYANKAHEKNLGYKSEDLLGKNLFDFIHPDDAHLLLTSLHKNLTQNGEASTQKNEAMQTETITCRIKNSAGAYAIIESSANLIENKFFVISRDVTAQAMLIEKLKTEKMRTDNYLDIVGNAIVVLNNNSLVTKINKSGCELLEDTEEHILGKNWFDAYIPNNERDAVKNVYGKISNDASAYEHYENHIIAKSGTKKLVHWHNKLLTNSHGEHIGTLSSGEEITERRKAEIEKAKAFTELEKFNKLTVGRELKMVALKDEIKDLKKQLKKYIDTSSS